MKWETPQIFEWLILPDDDTRIALNAVKLAMKDYKKKKYAQAEILLKGVLEANDSDRYRRMTAWLLARSLARQGKYEEAKEYLAKAYVSARLLADNLKVVGIMLKLQDGHTNDSRYFFEQAITYYAKANEKVGEAVCKYFLGTCQIEAGEFTDARRNLEEALPVLVSNPETNQEKKEKFIKNCKEALAELEEKEKAKEKEEVKAPDKVLN
jgi:tetratricopeptide (TPR) repeat protein